jgi:hypothetical protein
VVVQSYKSSVAPVLLQDLLAEPSVPLTMPLVQQLMQRVTTLPKDHPVRRVATQLYRGMQWLSDESVQGSAFWSTPVPGADVAFEPVRAFLRGAPKTSPGAG